MATKYVTLKDSNGDTLYPQAVATNLAPGSITSSEIDWSSFGFTSGSTNFTDSSATSTSWRCYRLGSLQIITARVYWNQSNTATATTNAWGSLFNSTNPPALGKWPLAFGSAPYVVGSVVQDTSANYSTMLQRIMAVTSTSAGNVAFLRQNSTSGMNVYLDIVAIGESGS